MENKYRLREVTPKEMRCLLSACPTIYEKTHKEMTCGIDACPDIYSTETETYLIVGKQINPEKFGLEGKVSKGEAVIEIPKKLIDEKEK